MPTLPHGLLEDDGCLEDEEDSDLGKLLTYGAPYLRSTLNADFDRPCVAREQADVIQPSEMADIVAVAEEGL